MTVPRRNTRGRRSTLAPATYRLWLYIAGSTPRSTTAIVNIMNICKQYLEGRYQLKIVDVFLKPEIARTQQIVATPTLVRESPQPRRVLVGDLSDTARVLAGLEIENNAA